MSAAPQAWSRPFAQRVIAVAVAASALSISAVGAASPASVRAAGTTAADGSADIAFRRAFGLTTDPAAMAAIAARPNTNASEFGVPLSDGELADLHERVRIQDAIGPLADFIADHASQVGGMFIDQAHGGTIVVAVTPGGRPLEPMITSLVPAGGRMRLQPVQANLASLEALSTTVARSFGSLRTSGIMVQSVGVDVAANSVDVGVLGLTSSQTASLVAQFGSLLRPQAQGPLTQVACTSRGSCTAPVRGGLDINNGVWECTSTFFLRANSSSQMYLATAGHCYDSNGQHPYWYEAGGSYVGYRSQINYYNGMHADIMTIAVTEAYAKNLVYVSDGEKGRQMTSALSNASQTAGSIACSSGIVSGYRCGTIVAPVNQTISVAGLTMYSQWEVNYSSGSGDSGSPVYYGNREMGLLHTTVVGQSFSYYSTIDDIKLDLPDRPCLDGPCS